MSIAAASVLALNGTATVVMTAVIFDPAVDTCFSARNSCNVFFEKKPVMVQRCMEKIICPGI